jgi:hypothetical protein
MRRSIAATAFIALGLLSPAAWAAAPPSPNVPCQMPGSDVATFLSVDELSGPIKQELVRYFSDSTGKFGLADRDADFRESGFDDSPDTGLPYARFVQAGHTGTRWYVWYELRGPRKDFESLIYDLPAGSPNVTFVAAQSVWPAEQLCPETQRHINDAHATARNFDAIHLSPGVPCALPGGDTQTYLRLDDMALPVRQALGRKFGDPTGMKIDMAQRDAAFQETDLIDGDKPPLSFQRFIQGGHTGRYWYVWYELGGWGYSYNIAYFELPPGSTEVPQMWRESALGISELCPLTTRLLAARGR